MGLGDFREAFFGDLTSVRASSDDSRQGPRTWAENRETLHYHQAAAITTNNHSNQRGQFGLTSYETTEAEEETGPGPSCVPLPARPRTADRLRQRLTTDAFEVPQEVALAFAALYQVRGERCCTL